MPPYMRNDTSSEVEEHETRRREERELEARGRHMGGLSPFETILIAVGFIVVTVLLSINLWATLNNNGLSGQSTLSKADAAKLVEEAVQKEREKCLDERNKHQGENVPVKSDMEKEKVTRLTKEAGVEAKAATSCGDSEDDPVCSSGSLFKGKGEGDSSSSDGDCLDGSRGASCESCE